MIRRPPQLLFVVAFTATNVALSQGGDPQPSVQDLAGCYTVDLGGWDQTLSGDGRFYRVPDTVWLDTVRVSGTGREPGFRLHPHIQALTRRRTITPRWWPVGPDSVRLAWSSGFVGVRIRLGRHGVDLVGRAEAFSDVVRIMVLPDGSEQPVPWPAAQAALRRIECQ